MGASREKHVLRRVMDDNNIPNKVNDYFKEFFYYKTDLIKVCDLDVTQYVVDIYMRTYPHLENIEICELNFKIPKLKGLKINDNIYRGDTLTSTKTAFKRYLAHLHDQKSEIKESDRTQAEIKFLEEFTRTATKESTSCTNNNTDLTWEKYVTINLLDVIESVIDTEAKEFVKNFDLLGNYMPLPGLIVNENSFNTLRSDWGAKDTVDKLLLHIYIFFIDNKGGYNDIPNLASIINLLVKSNSVEGIAKETAEKIAEEFPKYLKDFQITSWDEYLKVNKLMSFVGDNNVPKCLKTGEVFESKYLENPVEYEPMPKTIEEYLKFFSNYVEWTKARTDEICECTSRLKKGDYVKSFKREMVEDKTSTTYLYQIVDIVKHSETLEKMVLYKALYKPFGLWVRPYDMFMSEVDKIKYPEIKATYRFELMSKGEMNIVKGSQK